MKANIQGDSMENKSTEEERKVGRPAKNELDRLWDKIRQSLRNSAMGYMDIPHAQEFQVRATVNIGPSVRNLVDYELGQLLDEIINDRPLTTQHEPLNLYIERIKSKRKALKVNNE